MFLELVTRKFRQHPEKDNRVLVAQLETMYSQVKFLITAVVGLSLIVLNIFWDKVELIYLLGWACSNALVIISRVAFIIYSRANVNLNNAKTHAAIFALGSLLIGFIWSSATFIFLDTSDLISVVVMVTILLGTAAGSLVTFSAYLPAFYLYSSCVLGPLAWVLIGQSDGEITQLGYLVIIFWMSLIGYSHTINQNLRQFIMMRFENEGLLEDVQKQLNIAEKANIDKSRYLAATSHDLRQPLHALQLFLSNLASLANPDPQKFLIRKSITAGKTLNSLLSALMDVSRLDSGEVALDMRPVRLDELISEIAQEFHIQSESSSISLSVSSVSVEVVTDPLLLGRCLRNLLSNAFAHAKATEITIVVRLEADNQVLIEVMDNGIGIKQSEIENVFSEFYQLNNPERNRNKGLGLGLAIVKKLTMLMGHQICLSSNENTGCTFTIELTSVTQSADSLALVDEAIDISGVFIVVVDDDPDVCEAMSITLKRWGCEVVICASSRELMAEFSRINYVAPEVIIADYRLKNGLTGVEAVNDVRAFFAKQIPGILISGDILATIEAENPGLDCHYQQKPINPFDLKKLIADLVDPANQ